MKLVSLIAVLFAAAGARAADLTCYLTVGNHVAPLSATKMGTITSYRAKNLYYEVEMVVDGESYHLRASTPQGTEIVTGGFLNWIPEGEERSLLSFPRDSGDLKCSR